MDTKKIGKKLKIIVKLKIVRFFFKLMEGSLGGYYGIIKI
jgi:hypothetical protein